MGNKIEYNAGLVTITIQPMLDTITVTKPSLSEDNEEVSKKEYKIVNALHEDYGNENDYDIYVNNDDMFIVFSTGENTLEIVKSCRDKSFVCQDDIHEQKVEIINDKQLMNCIWDILENDEVVYIQHIDSANTIGYKIVYKTSDGVLGKVYCEDVLLKENAEQFVSGVMTTLQSNLVDIKWRYDSDDKVISIDTMGYREYYNASLIEDIVSYNGLFTVDEVDNIRRMKSAISYIKQNIVDIYMSESKRNIRSEFIKLNYAPIVMYAGMNLEYVLKHLNIILQENDKDLIHMVETTPYKFKGIK